MAASWWRQLAAPATSGEPKVGEGMGERGERETVVYACM